MNYTYQVAYLNTVKVKKLIPLQVLQEVDTSKNLSTLMSLLKEYKYPEITSFTNVNFLSAENFENVIYSELDNTVKFISQLLFDNDQWIINWFKYFFVPKEFNSIEDIINFYQNYTVLFQNLNSDFCFKLLRLVIDFENIKLFLTYVVTGQKDYLKFIPEGNIQVTKFEECYPQVEILNNYVASIFYPLVKLNMQQENIEDYFYTYLSNILWTSKFYYFTIEPIVSYFFEKLIETRLVKKIYYNTKVKTVS